MTETSPRITPETLLADLVSAPVAGRLMLVSGPSGAGKTRWCQALTALARRQNLQVAGLLSPAVFEGDRKVGIDLLDLSGGGQRRLATWRGAEKTQGAIHLGNWDFDPATLEWGNRLLASIRTCRLLVIDELGPLEFEQGIGLSQAFDLVASAGYRQACISLRPALLPAALARWHGAQVLDLTASPEAA